MKRKKGISRRQFIRNSSLGIMGAGMLNQGNWLRAGQEEQTESPKIREYRTLGRTGFKVSDISSGGPMEPAILSTLLDANVNYIDTAEEYMSGQSERIIGEVMKDRDRKSVFITTKLAIGRKSSKEQILKRTHKCLERLEMDYVDCLMIHSPDRVEIVKSPGFHEAVSELKAQGRVKYCGISNHGTQYKDKVDPTEQVVGAAVEDGRFDVILLVYNFIQKDSGETLLKICRKKNIGVTLMKTNPVRSYTFFTEMIEKLEKEGKQTAIIKALLPRIKKKADKADFFIKKYNLQNNNEIRDAAIRFVLNNQDVHSACITFQNFDEVESYIRLSGSRLSETDQAKLAAYTEGFGALYCRHACGICEPRCPHNVPVNTIMRYNHYFESQGREKYAMVKYSVLPSSKANLCLNCAGYCQGACPYDVPIQGLLALAHQNLTLA